MGFRVGALTNHSYKIGDTLLWDGPVCRPEVKPPAGNIRSIGYFYCDNLRCSTWSDCFPDVQQVVVVVENNVLVAVELHKLLDEVEQFQILEVS